MNTINPFQKGQEYTRDAMNHTLDKLDQSSLLNLSQASQKTNVMVLEYLRDISCPKIQKLMRFFFPAEQAEREIKGASEGKQGWEYVRAHLAMLDKPRDKMQNSLIHISVLSSPCIPYEAEMTLEDNNRIVKTLSGAKRYSLLDALIDAHANLEKTNSVGLNAMDITTELPQREAKNKLLQASTKEFGERKASYNSQDTLWLYKNPMVAWEKPKKSITE